MTENAWPVAAAKELVSRIDEGSTEAARDVLSQAVVGLREVAAGRSPDPERMVYLQWLLCALEQVLSGVPPKKALGLWTNNAPKTDIELRDAWLFMKVGMTLDRADENGRAKSVKAAIGEVAERLGIGDETVRKAWQSQGAAEVWSIARDDPSVGGAGNTEKEK